MTDALPGVPEEERTRNDYIQVRPALVRRLGGANEALVWTRVDWRVSAHIPPHVDDDGVAWWPATRYQLAEETGLSPDQAKRAAQSLVQAGFLAATEHRLGGNYDRTKSYRPIIRPQEGADSPTENGRIRPQEWTDSPNVLFSQTVKKTLRAISLREPAASEDQINLIRDLCIHSGELVPPDDQLRQLTKAEAAGVIDDLYAAVDRHSGYVGPEEGEPEYEQLSETGKRWADAQMVPQDVV